MSVSTDSGYCLASCIGLIDLGAKGTEGDPGTYAVTDPVKAPPGVYLESKKLA